MATNSLLIDFLKSFRFLKLKDISTIVANSKIKTFEEGDLLIKEGELCQEAMIVLKGIVRCYIVDEKGEEKNYYIGSKNTLVGSTESLILNEPSKENFEALEKTTVVAFNHFKMEELAEDNLSLTLFKVKHLEQTIIMQQERIRFFALFTPEERYQYLLDNHPEIVKRVHQKHIASFIGITPVSLSRIKGRFKEK